MPLSRARLLGLVAIAAGGLALVLILALGLRTAPSATAPSSAAPLLAPRFSRAPGLQLSVLAPASLPAPLDASWARATADQQVRLVELRGRPVVLNFWASWCDPCRREAPMLQRAWRAQHGRVLFLGVNQNDARDDALAFLRRYAITYPSLREAGDATAIRWGVRGFPVTYFLASDGRVVAQAIGQLRPGQLQRGIAAARTGKL